MSKHTPGPWSVKGNSIRAIDHALYFTIASVKSPKLTPEGNSANARLIAAAPDLLEALKNTERELYACQAVIHLAGGFDPAYVLDAQVALKDARTAIAKATGGVA